MGGQGSGRPPSVETILERQRAATPTPVPIGSELVLPNYSGIKDVVKKTNHEAYIDGTYKMSDGLYEDGTITIKDGIVTNITPAINDQVATPTATPTSQTFTPSINVSLSCATSGSIIYYTTDGSTPTNASTQYISQLTFTATTTLKARAYKTGMYRSEVMSETYTLSENMPTNQYVHYKLNETSGTTIDDSLNVLDATLSADISGVTASGKINNCFNFGNGSYGFADDSTSAQQTIGDPTDNGSYVDTSTGNYMNDSLDYTIWAYITAPDSVKVYSATPATFNLQDNSSTNFQNQLAWNAVGSAEGYIIQVFRNSNSSYWYIDIGNNTTSVDDGSGSGWTNSQFSPPQTSPYNYSADVGNFNLTNGHSLTFWIKSSDSGDRPVIFSKCDNSIQPGNGWYFKTDGTYVKLGANATELQLGNFSDLCDGSWHHGALTIDASNIKFYIDGSLKSTNSYSTTPPALAQDFRFGTNPYFGGGSWSGYLDDIRFYHKTLDATDISLIYASGSGTEAD